MKGDTQHNDTQHNGTQCSVLLCCVIMLSVVAPASGSSTIVKHLPHHPKVKGFSPPPVTCMGRQIILKNLSIVNYNIVVKSGLAWIILVK
jgi:hypothetical protein